MAIYDRLAERRLVVDEYDLELRERETSSGFTRTTTVITIRGEGVAGCGEDVTYESEDHYALDADRDSVALPPAGEYSVDEFSDALGATDLFPGDGPDRSVFRNYRRWGFESAALDLALKQADATLADALDREYEPVRFVASTRLGDPPSFDRVDALLDRVPDLELKLDPTSDWTGELIDRIAATDAVRVLDLKGHYEGTEVDQDPDPELYERLVEAFPEAVIEDPALTDETRPILEGETDRIAWDAPIHGVEDLQELPWTPKWCNLKPSRFGSIRSLCETIDYCRRRDVRPYGGGQFELDVGRQHVQALASVFYPDAPNDVAPRRYNDPDPPDALPASPLVPAGSPAGLEWEFER